MKEPKATGTIRAALPKPQTLTLKATAVEGGIFITNEELARAMAEVKTLGGTVELDGPHQAVKL